MHGNCQIFRKTKCIILMGCSKGRLRPLVAWYALGCSHCYCCHYTIQQYLRSKIVCPSFKECSLRNIGQGHLQEKQSCVIDKYSGTTLKSRISFGGHKLLVKVSKFADSKLCMLSIIILHCIIKNSSHYSDMLHHIRISTILLKGLGPLGKYNHKIRS